MFIFFVFKCIVLGKAIRNYRNVAGGVNFPLVELGDDEFAFGSINRKR